MFLNQIKVNKIKIIYISIFYLFQLNFDLFATRNFN